MTDPERLAHTRRAEAALPVDPDVDLSQPTQRAELRRAPWRLLSVIAAGGALGALARYGLGVAYPTAPTGFPWATFGINVAGCLFIGVLAVLVAEVYPDLPFLRPFVGVGFLGGFTTFSTYVADIQRLLTGHAAATAFAYLAATLVAALLAAQLGISATESAVASATARAAGGRRR
jgi:CrcB protein